MHIGAIGSPGQLWCIWFAEFVFWCLIIISYIQVLGLSPYHSPASRICCQEFVCTDLCPSEASLCAMPRLLLTKQVQMKQAVPWYFPSKIIRLYVPNGRCTSRIWIWGDDMGISCFPLIPLGFYTNTNLSNKESVSFLAVRCGLRPLLGTCLIL